MSKRLRTTLEVPDVYDTDANGNPIYPLEADGTVGGAFTYNPQHMGDPPPDPIVPKRSWWEFDNGDLMKAAAASALLLKKAANREHKRLDTAADVQRKNLADAAEADHARLGAAAMLTRERQIRDAAAAQERLRSVELPPTAAEGAPVRQDNVARTLAYEDSTNLPLYSQQQMGGAPAESPTGNDFNDASGPVPPGSEEGVHGPNEAGSSEDAHEDLMQRAHFAHLQARGAAHAAGQRREKALARLAELKARGLPTEAAEREAGWAYQQEMRARGMEQENIRIEDGQRWREREDTGAKKAHAEQEAGVKYNEALRKSAEDKKKQEEEAGGRMTPIATAAIAGMLTPDGVAAAASYAGMPYAPETQTSLPVTERDFEQRIENAGGGVGPGTIIAATTLSPAIQAQLDPANAGTIGEIVRENPTTPNVPWEQSGNGMQGPGFIFPADARFQAGRPVQDDYDLAYALSMRADDIYNAELDRMAIEQNKIETQDEPEDPMKGFESMNDANAPFTPVAVAERDMDAELAENKRIADEIDRQQEDLRKEGVADPHAAIIPAMEPGRKRITMDEEEPPRPAPK